MAEQAPGDWFTERIEMTEGTSDSQVTAPAASEDPARGGSRPPAGWYPDPWVNGQYRYWTGEWWTGDAFPSGPGGGAMARPTWAPGAVGGLGAAPPKPLPVDFATASAAPPPPAWSPAPSAPRPPVGDDRVPALPGAGPRRRRPSVAQLTVMAAVLGLLIGVLGGYLLNDGRSKPRVAALSPSTTAPRVPSASPTTTAPATSGPSGSTPATTPGGPSVNPGANGALGGVGNGGANGGSASTDPSASALSGLVVHQADVPSNDTVQTLVGGGQVTGETTLDLCNGTYPSESLRTGRFQVAVLDDQGNSVFSTEAVLYANAGGTAQAFTELRSVAAKCPSTPVSSPVGEPTVTTHFNAAPDASWPQTATVERLAFDFTATDDTGQATHSAAVYLRRGRVLMGLYFDQATGAQPAIAGQTSISGIVGVFATRMAALPASVTG